MIAHIDRENIASHLLGEVETVGIDVGDNNVARSGMPADRDGHAADRAGASDKHIFADQVERERRVRSISEGIETRQHIERNIRVGMQDNGHRDREKLRERALPIDSYSLSVGAKVAPTSKTVAATTANNVTFPS